MAGSIYRKPVLFTIVATVAVLVGSVVMMAYPMLRADMHPRLEKLAPLSPLVLAGRDVYQREGCVNCHTQTVRPLKAEVARYGDYSKAGEFAYDHPFLWGSKRTGPDLARIGAKYPDAWHVKHFEDPQAFAPKSNMPKYGFLKQAKLDPAEVRAHANALATLHPELRPADADVAALEGRTEMDALVAYMQWLGTAVERKRPAAGGDLALEAPNPLGSEPRAVARGQALFADSCAMCHGDEGHGGIGPSLIDDVFLGRAGDLADGAYFHVIHDGTEENGKLGDRATEGGMPPFGGQMSKDDIWSIVSYLRAAKSHETQETPAEEGAEHGRKQP